MKRLELPGKTFWRRKVLVWTVKGGSTEPEEEGREYGRGTSSRPWQREGPGDWREEEASLQGRVL